MIKNSPTLKETFVTAVQSYKEKNFVLAESLCKKIISIDPNHFDSLVLLSNIFSTNDTRNGLLDSQHNRGNIKTFFVLCYIFFT